MISFLLSLPSSIKWGAIAAAMLLSAYAGYHTRVVLDKAAIADRQTEVVNSIPTIIKETETITRVIRNENDKCTATAIPNSIVERLR